MLKIIGRITLIIVCILLGYTAFKTIIPNIDTLKARDWTDFSNIGELMPVFIVLLMQLVVLIFALSGLVAGITGKASLKFTLLSLLLLINVVLKFVDAYRADQLGDIDAIFKLTLDTLLPILYIVSSFLIRL